MNIRLLFASVLTGVLLPLGIAAADASKPIGKDTRAWIAQQKSPAATAKGPVRPMPGEAADRVYQRYLESFAHPIPERFDRDRFVDEGRGE